MRRKRHHSYLILIVRSDLATSVKGQLYNDIYDRLSNVLRPFLGTETFRKCNSAQTKQARNKQLYRFHIKIRRWHRLVQVVGWIAVFLANAIPSAVFNKHMDKEFETYVARFSLRKSRIMGLIKQHWFDAPNLIHHVGGN